MGKQINHRRGRPIKFTPSEVIYALLLNDGDQRATARYLGCSRRTIRNYIDDVPDIANALNERRIKLGKRPVKSRFIDEGINNDNDSESLTTNDHNQREALSKQSTNERLELPSYLAGDPIWETAMDMQGDGGVKLLAALRYTTDAYRLAARKRKRPGTVN